MLVNEIALNYIQELEEQVETLKEEMEIRLIGREEYVKYDMECEIDMNYIPKQKMRDKIREYKNLLKTCNKAEDIERIKGLNERILAFKEVLNEEV